MDVYFFPWGEWLTIKKKISNMFYGVPLTFSAWCQTCLMFPIFLRDEKKEKWTGNPSKNSSDFTPNPIEIEEVCNVGEANFFVNFQLPEHHFQFGLAREKLRWQNTTSSKENNDELFLAVSRMCQTTLQRSLPSNLAGGIQFKRHHKARKFHNEFSHEIFKNYVHFLGTISNPIYSFF